MTGFSASRPGLEPMAKLKCKIVGRWAGRPQHPPS